MKHIHVGFNLNIVCFTVEHELCHAFKKRTCVANCKYISMYKALHVFVSSFKQVSPSGQDQVNEKCEQDDKFLDKKFFKFCLTSIALFDRVYRT